jgi:hypothetical protein
MSRDPIRIFIGMMIVLSTMAFCTLPSGVQADWRNNATMEMSYVGPYIGEICTLTFTLNNGEQKSEAITSFFVSFDWQTTNFGYQLVDSGAVTIPAGSSHKFTLDILIPQVSTGPHSISIKVVGQEVGDWFESTMTWTKSISLSTIPSITVSLSANPTNGNSPLDVSFYSTVNGGLAPFDYSWSFGDGSTSSFENPSHKYTQAGTYTVTLIVTDGKRSDSSQTTVIVNEASVIPGIVGGSPGSTNSLLIVLAMIGVVGIVVIGVVVLLRKKRSPPAPPLP